MAQTLKIPVFEGPQRGKGKAIQGEGESRYFSPQRKKKKKQHFVLGVLV